MAFKSFGYENIFLQQFFLEKASDQLMVRTTAMKQGLFVIELWNEHTRLAFAKLILSK